MKKIFLLSVFCALFCAATEARANIYGLIVLAENPALNLMEGTSLMLMTAIRSGRATGKASPTSNNSGG